VTRVRYKIQTVARFAPKANPEIEIDPQTELQTLIATDILSEGLNLRDGMRLSITICTGIQSN
jgi:hypothetical protein